MSFTGSLSADSRQKRQTGKHLPAFLLLLIAKRPAHGGALMTELGELLPDWTIDSGGVYRVLRDMEEHGLLHSAWDTPDGGPPRRIYMLTSEGRQELERWREDILARKRGLDLFVNMYDEWIRQNPES
ncbi:PadR family transcriptional regulator [Sulfoacidibacillus thermotolerans]|uniref:Transcription regulator PadR N-terminal domain-containing protein n=1 Tax=Sulfoacidibacillus thermotolerans TaxID=1765684 RepID=A0A2U3D7G0_SULT2|nr:PadR family transcriptional regulator [Sulfoacidibacillus thermotolerans]PWI57215.1 hypothetical protein BM613_09485 [Sulfoacidibacillus thermotolerans]